MDLKYLLAAPKLAAAWTCLCSQKFFAWKTSISWQMLLASNNFRWRLAQAAGSCVKLLLMLLFKYFSSPDMLSAYFSPLFFLYAVWLIKMACVPSICLKSFPYGDTACEAHFFYKELRISDSVINHDVIFLWFIQSSQSQVKWISIYYHKSSF